MKKRVSMLSAFLILILSCQQTDKNLDKFYAFLGDEQSIVLQETVVYFNQFLDDNFKNEKNKEDKVYQFLKYLSDHELRPNEDWIYDKAKCKLIIEEFEKTGLRKEIRVYEYELYAIHTDSLFNTGFIEDGMKLGNKKTTAPNSRIVIGMDKFKTNDSLIYHYTNGILTLGDISPSLLIQGLLKADRESYNDPFFDILIINELFYGLMEYNCK